MNGCGTCSSCTGCTGAGSDTVAVQRTVGIEVVEEVATARMAAHTVGDTAGAGPGIWVD